MKVRLHGVEVGTAVARGVGMEVLIAVAEVVGEAGTVVPEVGRMVEVPVGDATAVLVREAVDVGAAIVGVRVGVAVLPPGVLVGVGVRHVPVTAVKAKRVLVAGAVLHLYWVKLPWPSCTPIVEVARVLRSPRMMSKLEVPSYSLISK